MTEEVFIVSNDPQIKDMTDFEDCGYGAIIVGTPDGIIAKFANEGGYEGDEVSVSWADLLKHAPIVNKAETHISTLTRLGNQTMR